MPNYYVSPANLQIQLTWSATVALGFGVAVYGFHQAPKIGAPGVGNLATSKIDTGFSAKNSP